jgi:hypothetical protein
MPVKNKPQSFGNTGRQVYPKTPIQNNNTSERGFRKGMKKKIIKELKNANH